MKKIRLSENQLHRVINESIKRILKEKKFNGSALSQEMEKEGDYDDIITFCGDSSDEFNEGEDMSFQGYAMCTPQQLSNTIHDYYQGDAHFQIDGQININDRVTDFYDEEAIKFFKNPENRNRLFIYEFYSDGNSSGRQRLLWPLTLDLK
jgi:hypothetical protein